VEGVLDGDIDKMLELALAQSANEHRLKQQEIFNKMAQIVKKK
jgi:hypothetical protein